MDPSCSPSAAALYFKDASATETTLLGALQLHKKTQQGILLLNSGL